jgi:hypothetical protein
MRALADLIDTDPITLSEASSVVLRGIVSVSALRAEIDKGNLMAMRIGKNLFTTPGAVREMMEKCRVKPSHPASEQAALKGIAAALRSGSLATSRKNTRRDRQSAENLVQFPSGR